MKYVLILVAAIALSLPAFAQHKHGAQKGPNGGAMQDVAGVHAELVTSGNTLTLNIFDESNKPISTAGFSGSALIVAGTERETVALAPTGSNALKGEAKKAVGSGAAITVMVKTAAGKTGQVKF
ncbi:MAG TPA: hypothetical protein VJ890_01410 [Vineibacter sp.]|nr:hypothetical protein [Vineibacter sp.]